MKGLHWELKSFSIGSKNQDPILKYLFHLYSQTRFLAQSRCQTPKIVKIRVVWCKTPICVRSREWLDNETSKILTFYIFLAEKIHSNQSWLLLSVQDLSSFNVSSICTLQTRFWAQEINFKQSVKLQKSWLVYSFWLKILQ